MYIAPPDKAARHAIAEAQLKRLPHDKETRPAIAAPETHSQASPEASVKASAAPTLASSLFGALASPDEASDVSDDEDGAGVSADWVARTTAGYSGAELVSVFREASLAAVEEVLGSGSVAGSGSLGMCAVVV